MNAIVQPRVAVIVPAYRARATLARVVRGALEVADTVIVVDDACPDRCSEVLPPDERVHVIVHDANRGVGGATKTGIAEALRLGARYIVKVDADDQMDTSYVPAMIDVLERYDDVDLVKGNRFTDTATLHTMPALRLFGNAALTLLVKFSSGYWTIVDPTNGFIALRASEAARLGIDALADRYFFEIDLLSALGLNRRVIAELEMPAIYGGETSSLSIANALLTFPPRLFGRFFRRLLLNYLIIEINVGTLCGLLGVLLLLAGTIFGAEQWHVSSATGVSRPTGTIILALLLFMTGFQLTLQALLYDVQFSSRTVKVHRESDRRRENAIT